ncbi:unnamed protein product [Cuscuta campestris]|uniref:Chromo domain-containing protein n=1 Tax=Cuscuta campestris TaxID=132261 RepID=A0A484N343_9ASTE|nr:unnamed protein product [Cuscuta campestris]
MKHKGCYPDLVMCNMLIDCLSKMGSYDDAIIIFCSLGERGLTPDSYTLASIMSTLCLCKEFTLLPVLISGLEIILDLVVCNSFMSFYCKAGYPRGAVEFCNDMMHRRFLPDNYTSAGLLSGLCRVGKITQAVDVAGEFRQAIRLFRNALAEKSQLDVVSYTIAIDGLVKASHVRDAYVLFNEMKDIGLAPNIYTYSLMLFGLCKDGDLGIVKKLLAEMIDGGIKFNHINFRLMKNILRKRRGLCSDSNYATINDDKHIVSGRGLAVKFEQQTDKGSAPPAPQKHQFDDYAEDKSYGEVNRIINSRAAEGGRGMEYLIEWRDEHPPTCIPSDLIAKDVVAEYEIPWWTGVKKAGESSLRELLNAGDGGRDADAVDEDGRTALLFVSGFGSEDCLVLLGDSGVGKSCIVLRFVRGQFDPTSKVTVGASFLSQTITCVSVFDWRAVLLDCRHG